MSNDKQGVPLFEASRQIQDVDKYIMDTGAKRVRQKSQYYSWSCALEILPDLIDMARNPTESRIYPIAAFGVKPTTLSQKIGAAWQYICDRGDTDPYLAKFITTPDLLNKIREARAMNEITVLDTAVIIRQRVNKYKKSREMGLTRKDPVAVDWRVVFRQWLSEDGLQVEPLRLTGIEFRVGEAEKLRNVLIGMSDLYDYNLGADYMWIKLREKGDGK